jgi:uncharacterized protein (DUF2147 family)
MRAQATATTGCIPRRTVIRVKSVMAVRSRLMAAAFLGGFCVAGAAFADPAKISATDVAGRWVSEKYKLTLDVSPCGAGWCGVEVTDRALGAGCGRTALRFDAGEEAGQYVSFRGRLERAANSQSYAILANLQRRDGVLTLSMHGNSGDDFNPFRRTFDFNDVVARVGDGVCRPDPKLS